MSPSLRIVGIWEIKSQLLPISFLTNIFIEKSSPTAFSTGSHIWKSIGKGWESYHNRLAWEVDDGSSINLWNDRWIGKDLLRSLLIGPIMRGGDVKTVSELKDMPSSQIHCFLSFPIPSELCVSVHISSTVFSTKSDRIFSDWHKKGKFCSSLARDIVMDRKLSCVNFVDDWNWVWGSVWHPKMQFFFWKLWWDRLAIRKKSKFQAKFNPLLFFLPRCDRRQ